MFDAKIASLKEEIAALKQIVLVHEEFRSISRLSTITSDTASDTLDTEFRAALSKWLRTKTIDLPNNLSWRVFDRSAAFVRLYGLYERFVFDLISDWLRLLPDYYQNYSDLPEKVQSAHRQGVGTILTRLGGDRYGPLREKEVLQGIFEGVSGTTSYSLLQQAFLTDDRNLWKDALTELFSRVGLDGSWEWICKNPIMIEYISEVRGNNSSVFSELKSFVQFRNAAAHGEMDDTVSIAEINRYSEFIEILCESLAELVTNGVVFRQLAMNCAEKIGSVVHKFSGSVIGARVIQIRLNVGDDLYVTRESRCYRVKILSLSYNRTILNDFINVGNDNPIGLKLDRLVNKGSELIRAKSDSPRSSSCLSLGDS